MKTLTVTGADGFVGQHVVELAVDAGYVVHGVVRSPEIPPALRERLASVHVLDLEQGWPPHLIDDAVIHLAGLAAVGPSFDQPQRYLTGNSSMVTHLCEAFLREGAVHARILGVSSGAVYAPPPRPSALDEQATVHATSPYAVSKLLVETQLDYYRTRGLNTVLARPFNHIGPGQRRGFIVPDLWSALDDLDGDQMLTGNLETRRDYTDVRDVARAYISLISQSTEYATYNVASGTSHSGTEILAAICTVRGRAMPRLVRDPARFRPNDAPEIVGDATRLRSELRWHATIPLETSIEDFARGLDRPA